MVRQNEIKQQLKQTFQSATTNLVCLEPSPPNPMLPIEDILAPTVFTPERYDSSTSFYRSFHRRRHHDRRRHNTTIEGLKIYEITFPQCRRRRRRFLLLLRLLFLSISTQESPVPDGIFVRSAEAGKKWKSGVI